MGVNLQPWLLAGTATCKLKMCRPTPIHCPMKTKVGRVLVNPCLEESKKKLEIPYESPRLVNPM